MQQRPWRRRKERSPGKGNVLEVRTRAALSQSPCGELELIQEVHCKVKVGAGMEETALMGQGAEERGHLSWVCEVEEANRTQVGDEQLLPSCLAASAPCLSMPSAALGPCQQSHGKGDEHLQCSWSRCTGSKTHPSPGFYSQCNLIFFHLHRREPPCDDPKRMS